ncbi:MAG: hypothetical protein KAS73_00925 [Candidatus Sabulitectum sp.]|nr:hypothetical protein [Candidatus Sabulitectum sp.]
MLLPFILYVAAVIALAMGASALANPETIMQQTFGSIHIIGGILFFGVGYAVQRINKTHKELVSWKADIKAKQVAKTKAEAKKIEPEPIDRQVT